jgi:murein DD-endopeptidase MepM/ murein hydrolase activator NlpD
LTASSRQLAPGHVDAVERYFQANDFAPVAIVETDGRSIVLDLGRGSNALGEPLVNIDVERFGRLVNQAMADADTEFAFGRYGEDRELYSNENFDRKGGSESRSIHMGIDLFCAAGTRVRAPLHGTVEVVANNTGELDYGPMLVIRHAAGEHDFLTLYGHLNLSSISHLQVGQGVRAGDNIAAIGRPPENGNWPPHLHFQLILDLFDFGRDFPGVAYPSERSFWLTASPSPAVFFAERDAALLNCPP